jgi:hypothetical protein
VNQYAGDFQSFGRRLIGACIRASLLLLVCGDRLICPLLPPFETVFRLAKPGFDALFHIEVSPDGHQIITASAYTTVAVALDATHSIAPFTHLDQTVYVDLVHALIPPVILLTGLLAWPFTGFREILQRTLLGLLGLFLTLCLTTPLYLAGLVETVVTDLAHADGVKTSTYPSPLRMWMIFTELGGLWLLPIVLATVCIGLSRRVVSERQATHSDNVLGPVRPQPLSNSACAISEATQECAPMGKLAGRLPSSEVTRQATDPQAVESPNRLISGVNRIDIPLTATRPHNGYVVRVITVRSTRESGPYPSSVLKRASSDPSRSSPTVV